MNAVDDNNAEGITITLTRDQAQALVSLLGHMDGGPMDRTVGGSVNGIYFKLHSQGIKQAIYDSEVSTAIGNLSRMKIPKPPVTVPLNDNYEATIHPNDGRITVGCQTIPKENVEAFIEAYNKSQSQSKS